MDVAKWERYEHDIQYGPVDTVEVSKLEALSK